MTHPSWVVLHSMAHSFIELCKHLCHNKAVIHEGENYYMTQQSLSWAYTLRKPQSKKTHAPQCSLQHCLLYLGHGSSLDVHRWMDKKVVVHIHNGILLSYKKECTWVSSNKVDEPRVYYTECSVQYSSVAQSCPTLCNPMNCSTPGLPVHHQLPEFTQTQVHRVSDAIQPFYPLSSPSPPSPNPSQHQSFPMSQLFAWGGQSTGVSALASVGNQKNIY